MRVVKLVILVLAVSVASITARQLIQRRSSVVEATATKTLQRRQAIEVVSSVQRHETEKYGLSDIALRENGDASAVGYDGEHVDRLYFSNDRQTWKAVDVPGTGFTMSAIGAAVFQKSFLYSICSGWSWLDRWQQGLFSAL